MRRALIAVGVVGLVLSMAPAGAVTGGAPDGPRHPYVATVVPPGAAGPGCSGVVVGTVVLTAAHCVFHAGRRTGTGVRVSFASSFAGAPLTSGRFYVDPLYDPARSQDHDLAVIVLDSPAPVRAARLAAVGASSGFRGGLLTVGVGAPHVGVRWQATELVVGRHGGWLELVPVDGNSCDGDSGGPDLLPGTDTVMALTDQGSCSHDSDQRVDTVEAHQLVAAAALWPTHRPLVRSVLPRTAVLRHESAALDVRVSPLYAGDLVTRQERVGATWVSRESRPVDRSGVTHFRFRAGTPGVRTLRVALASTGTHPASTSRPCRLLVR